MNSSFPSRVLPALLLLSSLNAQSPYQDPDFVYPPFTNYCGVPNEPSTPPCRCKDCEKSACPSTGADSDTGGSGSGDSNQGPSPHEAATHATNELEIPSTVIGTNHGGSMLKTTDLSIPGSTCGIPLEFTRYYNSRDAESIGDLMGHGRSWTHSWSWRMTAPGATRVIYFPTGRKLEFTYSSASTYLGQVSSLYLPTTGNGERLQNIGDFWYLVFPGGASHTFERVVRASDGAVFYHPRSGKDIRGNTLTYTTNSAARITKVTDSVGNYINLTYSTVTINRRAAVNLHTISAAPVVGWNEVIIPAGQSFRWIQAVSAPNAYFDVSEIKFYKTDGSGAYVLLNGSPYGTDPAIDDGANTFEKAFDGSGSTRFTFCRPNGGTAGLDLGASGAASVTKIRYYIFSALSGELSKFIGTRFEGMTEQPLSHTVLSAVTASTGQSVEFDYGSHTDVSIGQSHSVLEKVTYRNAANVVTDEADITWVTAQQGTSPCVERAREPRSKSATPDIAFDYYPGHIAVKGQPARVLTGDPSGPKVIQISKPKATLEYVAPDGGSHTIVNNNSGAFLPSSTTDAGGKTTSYSWTSGRFLASKTTPAGTTTYTRNGRGQPLTITRPDGLVTTHTYDSGARLLSTTLSASGFPSRTTTYTRDSNGRVTKITYPDTSYEDYTYNSLGLLTTVREKNGSFTKHTYDTTTGSPTAGLRLSTTRGLPTSTATTGGETTTFTWHLPGNSSGSPARTLASETNPRGRTTSFEYDHAGRLTKTTYPDGSFRQLVLDDFGNKLNEFDGSSLEEWTYDDFRRPLTHTNAASGVTTYDYGLNGSSCSCYGSGAPTLVTSPAGRKTLRAYDLMGRLTSETQGYTSADAATTTRTYDVLGRLTSVGDPDGFFTNYTYDSQGRTLTTAQAPYTLNLITSHTYSPFGDTLSTTAPGSRTTTMVYDKMSRPVTITDPLGTVTSVTYDLGGRRTAVTEAFGTASARTTGFAYNLFDRLTTTTYADATTTSQTYHPGGETASSTDELGRTTTSDTTLVTWTDSLSQSWTSFARTTTDPAGNTTTTYGPPMAFTGGTRRIVSPGGRIAESFIDELGRSTLVRSGLVTATSGLTADVSDTVMTHDADGLVLTATVDPTGLNLTTTNTYDALGRTKTSTDPLNRTTTYTYDKRGNRTKTKLPDNREHLATFDALSRQLTTTDPKNQTITYTYWYETSQQLTLKDARNNITNWTYNLRGQILTKTYPNGDDHAYTYDALGRIATHTTPLNHVCTYTYDLRDRQTLANWNTTTPDTAKTYWANGLLKSIDNGVSKSDYAYNSRNLLTSETQTLSGQSARVVSYDYDADGLRTDLAYPSAQAIEYTWNARAQLETVVADTPPPLATYTYDKAGRNTALVHENGITESKSYDAASQLLANTHLKGGTPVSGHGYTLDSTGRRTAETFADGSTPTRSYGYDTADQVTAATYSSSQTDTYAYDAMGNRTTATIASQGGGTISYGTANTANQYTTITGLTPISHDANGNLLQQNGVTYTWDSENRLLTLTPNTPALGDKSLVHTYDGNHRRVTRTTREWTSTGWSTLETLHFIYDGWNVIEEYSIATTATLHRTRTWGNDLGGADVSSASLQNAGGVGGLLLTEEITGSTTTAYHFHYDGNGNVTEITDLNGNPAATYRYDAFGNTLVATGSYATSNRYRFSTKPLDSEVANAPLYYYGYRYYDPTTGRWPSRDPIEENGGINLYGFVGNDGINRLDNLGLIQIKSDAWPYYYYTLLTFVGTAVVQGKVNSTGNCDEDTGLISNEALQVNGNTDHSIGAAVVWNDIGIGLGASVSIEFTDFKEIASDKKNNCTTKTYQFTAKRKHQIVDAIRTVTKIIQETIELKMICCCKKKT